MGLEALALELVRQLKDADPTFPPARDEQLVPRGHGEHGGARVMAAEGWADGGEVEKGEFIKRRELCRTCYDGQKKSRNRAAGKV